MCGVPWWHSIWPSGTEVFSAWVGAGVGGQVDGPGPGRKGPALAGGFDL